MQHFTNEPIDLNQLPTYQSVQLFKPHPSYWKVIIINIVILLLLLGGALAALIFNVPEFKAQAYLITGGYLVFSVLLFVIYSASFKKRGYALREKDIIYKSGIIAETTTIVPLNRIQHVALDEGVFSRIFKLGKLQIYTAGGQTGHLKVSGIEIEKAKNIKELLLKKLVQIDTQTEDQS